MLKIVLVFTATETEFKFHFVLVFCLIAEFRLKIYFSILLKNILLKILLKSENKKLLLTMIVIEQKPSGNIVRMERLINYLHLIQTI